MVSRYSVWTAQRVAGYTIRLTSGDPGDEAALCMATSTQAGHPSGYVEGEMVYPTD